MITTSWSTTRARAFSDCPRKYFFQYHLAPRARLPGAPAAAGEAAKVRDLMGLHQWAGDLVHRILQGVFNRWRGGRDYGEEDADHDALLLMRRQYRDSQAFWTAHPDEFPKKPVLLDRHYYPEGDLSREQAEGLKEIVRGSLRSFLRSDLAVRIRGAGASSWLPIERYASCNLPDGTHILVKPDFAFREGERLRILDWKTGQPDPYWETIQGICYALYASEKWDAPLDRIAPDVVHLHPDFRVSPIDHADGEIARVKLIISTTQEAMASMLERAGQDADGLPAAEAFPFTEEARRCRWCQYRGICDGAARGS